MEMKRLNNLMRSIKSSGVKQIRLENATTKIKITRNDDEIKSSLAKGRRKLSAPEFDFKSTVTQPPVEQLSKAKDDEKSKFIDLKSSEIGFFSRFNPQSKKQYFKLRDIVTEGDIIGVVKSMHVDHEVLATHTGKIIEFLVEEGQPVEYGQPLFRIDPTVKD